MFTVRCVTALCCLSISAAWALAGEQWKPAPNALMTPWAEKLDPAKPLPEYPRPQMVRADWTNLNGLWDYAITARNAAKPAQFDGKILVPFPVESALSGVKKPLLPTQRLWYRRTFAAPDLAGGKRLLLHFGAVDWESTVSVNGKEMGTHPGGYDSFSYDITDALKSGENELIVSVWDPTGTNGGAKGKQNLGSMQNPGGIMYTPCSGIWQTVWLEPVPAARIAGLKILPDVDQKRVTVQVQSVGGRTDAVDANYFEATAFDGEQQIGGNAGPNPGLVISVPQPKLWTPDSPHLYRLRVRMGNDTVESYFGMRKISIGKDEKGITRLLLNDEFVFQSGPLDQGFWPDGIYTAPTDEALKYDIEITRKLGFNATRKHVKIEPERWYYWCDRLGLLVWQDMPSGGAGRGGNRRNDGTPASPASAAQFEGELKAMIEQHANHPSIIMWVVFNEGWGQYDTARLVEWVRKLDPTRLVNNASGWTDRACGDVIDMHSYPGPASPNPQETRAAVLGEFGGLGLPVEGHKWVDLAWGYRGMSSMKQLNNKYIDLWRGVWDLRQSKGLSAAIYTQITDVETESNGLLTYDRKVIKVDVEKTAAAIADGKFPAPPTYTTLVATAEKEPIEWRYTVEKPADDWFKSDFDDSAWKKGPAGFGTNASRFGTVRTPWKTPDIWLRRQINLPEGKLDGAMLRVYHDDDAEVYINGVPAAKLGGYIDQYDAIELSPAGVAALKVGANVIAVHCRQVRGGQYIDLGLVQQQPPRP